jgi:alpha/beta superfamily hydrolase
MPTEFLREIPGPAGALEALFDLPEGQPRAVTVFGHPHPLHGGTLHTKGVYQAAKGMTRIGVASLRFNFRGVGRSAGTFDSGVGEQEDFRAAIDFAQQRYPDTPVWAAGMSFGAWVAMTTGASDPRLVLNGIAPPIDRTTSSCTSTTQIHRPVERQAISIKDIRRFYSRSLNPRELASSTRIICSTAKPACSGQIEDLLETVRDAVMFLRSERR